MQLIFEKVLGILLLLFSQYSMAQVFIVDSLAIDTIKEIKEVKPIEANFLFSYYEQDGTKSPVTGGIGDEALNDMVGDLSLNIPINNKLAVLFSGGVDISPFLYNKDEKENFHNITNLKRDSLEIRLVKYALKEKLPLLGICRWEQIINVTTGGTLVKDIPSEFKNIVKCRPDIKVD